MTIPSNIRPDYRPIGANGTLLMGDSSQAEGTKWAVVSQNDVAAAFTINSFSVTPSGIMAGYSVPTLNFAASYNRSASGGRVANDFDGSWGSLNMTATTYTAGTLSIDPSTDFGTVVHYTLTASGFGGATTATASYSVMQMKYWGVGSTGTYNSAFIKALPSSGLALSNSGTITVNAASGQYIWYAFVSSVGTPTFNYNTFYGGFTLVSTGISLNNGVFAENYQLWRSDNHWLGSTTVGIL